jgi:hypothetical protein
MLHGVRLLGTPTILVTVFVSSGVDALQQRDFIDALVRDAVNAALARFSVKVRFEVDRWERTAPHKITQDGSANDEFVARAKQASLVVGILIDKMGEGTREELEAVLPEDDVELSIVWCEDREGQPDSAVSRWLAGRQDDVVYDRAGRPDTPGPQIAITRLFIEAMLSAMRDHAPKELWHEVR